jgi:two-component system, NtrC family, sensor kinase
MPGYPSDHDAEELRQLITRFLHEADKGMPLPEFLRQATGILLGSAGGGSVVIRVDDWIPGLRCRAVRSSSASFHFETESETDDLGSPAGVGLAPAARVAAGVRPVPAAEPPQVRICRALLNGSFDHSQSCFTRRGSFWTRDARRCPPLELGPEGGVPVRAWAEAGNFRSLILIPFQVAGRTRGLLQLVSERSDRFDFPDVLFFEEASDLLGLALTHHRANWALQERVKELTCLYQLATIAGRSELPVPLLLQEIVEVLPPGWQYPENCAARILLDGKAYATDNFTGHGPKQSCEIVVQGAMQSTVRGVVEVVYTSVPPEAGALPFLEEEEKLIHEIARQIGFVVESRERAEEQGRLEVQLRHSDRLATIGKLTAGVAHELNEPIGSILGFAELLQQSGTIPSQSSSYLHRIHRAALHAREIIKKLMLFGRQTPPGEVWTDLNAVVGEGLDLLQPQLARGRIALERREDPGLPRFLADPRQIQQVVVNLVINAVQAMPQGGRLLVSTRAENGSVVLVVEDTGTGIPEDVLPQIFVPFFTTKDVGQGVGLGLSVVHGIITSHGGTIQVESSVGNGTRFTVQLPVRTPTQGKEGAP